MNATVQLSEIVLATLASAALALGIDWLLLCAAFRAMSNAPYAWRMRHALAPAPISADAPRMSSPQRRAA
jgi:hypothetical protein